LVTASLQIGGWNGDVPEAHLVDETHEIGATNLTAADA
jgi:hypothetical protein